ncbi:MAG: N-acetyltransferase [Gammaproteobacteria bacterium]|nr:N-acetyltransferase [Gammaproteobacteria bacterium]
MNTQKADKGYDIVPASLDDVPGIFRLLQFYSDQEVLLPRPESDIYRSLRDFRVIRRDQTVIACVALLIYTEELGEVRSLAVDPEYLNCRLGYRLVQHIENEAQRLGLKKLMALTYVEDFFRKLDFNVVKMSVLPEKVWGACINCHKFRNCDEIAVLKYINQKKTPKEN